MGLSYSQSHSPLQLSSPPPSFPPVKMAAQQIRQNYHEECEALVNKHINLELYASYVYTAIANYFNRVDQAFPGFAFFFKRSSNAVFNHGGALMEYQTKRGGKVVLQDITKPNRMEWGTPLEAFTAVLEMEKKVTLALEDLQAVAMEKKDFHLVEFIQKEFLVKKVNIIKEIGDCLTKIKRVGDGLGLHIIDRELEKLMVTQTMVNLQTLATTWKNTVQGEVPLNKVEMIKEITDCLAAIRMI